MVGTVTDFFNAAWNQYLAENPGADKMAWFAANGTNLQRYYDTTVANQKQRAAPAPAAPIAPTTPVPPAGSGAFGSDPVAMANLEQGIQNIMRDKGMTHDQAVAALNGPKSVESGTGLPKGVTFSPVGEQEYFKEQKRAAAAQEEQARQNLEFQRQQVLGKVNGQNTLESVKYSNDILSNPQNAALAEQVRKGYALGDMPGQTVADYLNRSVDNPAKQVAPALEGAFIPTSPPRRRIPGYEGGGAYGFQDTPDGKTAAQNAMEFAAAMKPAVKQYRAQIAQQLGGSQSISAPDATGHLGTALRATRQILDQGPLLQQQILLGQPVDEGTLRKIYGLVAGPDNRNKSLQDMLNEVKGMDFHGPKSLADADSGLSQTLRAYAGISSGKPQAGHWYSSFFFPATEQQNIPTDSGTNTYTNKTAAEVIADEKARSGGAPVGPQLPDPNATPGPIVTQTPTPPGTEAKLHYGTPTPTPARKTGGAVTIGGQPHWIVDNAGKPVAALTEDGKKEQVKGKTGGVEVVPLDPKRHAAYEARKNGVPSMPGMVNGGLGSFGSSARTAPSRRPGASAANSSRTLSGQRASLTGGGIADTRQPVADGRANNGQTNNGRTTGVYDRRTASDKDAAGVMKTALTPMAAAVQARIAANGPTKVKVTPGASYMPNNPAAGQGWLGTPVVKKPDMRPQPVQTAPVTMQPFPAMPPPVTMNPWNHPLGNPLSIAPTPVPGRAMGGMMDIMRGKPMGPQPQQPTGAVGDASMVTPDGTQTVVSPDGTRNSSNIGSPASVTPDSQFMQAVQMVMQKFGVDAQTAVSMLQRMGDIGSAASVTPDGTQTEAYPDGRRYSSNIGTPASVSPPQMNIPGAGPMPVAGRAVGGTVGIPGSEVIKPLTTPVPAPVGNNPQLIASGGSRVIGPGYGGARFGFNQTAPSSIAGANQLSGVKNTPGVFVRAPWKWNPHDIATMTPADRTALESYIRATGGDPATFYEQLGQSEAGQAGEQRSFYG